MDFEVNNSVEDDEGNIAIKYSKWLTGLGASHYIQKVVVFSVHKIFGLPAVTYCMC